jgi:hypothetical protein
MSRSPWIAQQTIATRALVKFIIDHGSQPDADLQACLASLEAGDISDALSHAKLVKPHGMGGISDWWPPVTFDNENPEYVATVLEALVNNWCRLISLSFETESQSSNHSLEADGSAAAQL